MYLAESVLSWAEALAARITQLVACFITPPSTLKVIQPISMLTSLSYIQLKTYTIAFRERVWGCCKVERVSGCAPVGF